MRRKNKLLLSLAILFGTTASTLGLVRHFESSLHQTYTIDIKPLYQTHLNLKSAFTLDQPELNQNLSQQEQLPSEKNDKNILALKGNELLDIEGRINHLSKRMDSLVTKKSSSLKMSNQLKVATHTFKKKSGQSNKRSMAGILQKNEGPLVTEIKNDDLVKHNGFNIDLPSTTNWMAYLDQLDGQKLTPKQKSKVLLAKLKNENPHFEDSKLRNEKALAYQDQPNKLSLPVMTIVTERETEENPEPAKANYTPIAQAHTKLENQINEKVLLTKDEFDQNKVNQAGLSMNDQQMDQVTTHQAQKAPQDLNSKGDKSDQDDLIFFEYPAANKETLAAASKGVTIPSNRHLSSTLNEVIQREISKSNQTDTHLVSTQVNTQGNSQGKEMVGHHSKKQKEYFLNTQHLPIKNQGPIQIPSEQEQNELLALASTKRNGSGQRAESASYPHKEKILDHTSHSKSGINLNETKDSLPPQAFEKGDMVLAQHSILPVKEKNKEKFSPNSIEELIKKEEAKFVKQDLINSTLALKAVDAQLGVGTNELLRDFDLRPLYSYLQVFNDEDGIINLSNRLSDGVGIFNGAISKAGHVITNVDLTLEKGEFEFIVPLVEIESMHKFLDKNKLKGIGGFVLVDLDDQTEKVDLNVQYEKKIYLNSQLKKVGSQEDYQYVFFVGVNPGNALMTYQTFDKKSVSKIINVNEDEIFFEANSYLFRDNEHFFLHETNVLSRTKAKLELEPGEIQSFSAGRPLKKLGQNRYEMIPVPYPLGSRAYFELKHLADSLFVGTWGNKNLDIPSADYIGQVFNVYNLQDLSSQCLIQINISKPVQQVMVDGKSSSTPLGLNIIYLDDEGKFHLEYSETTRKVFILGDLEGLVNGKFQYLDGSVDFLKTYCAEETYLIEQL